MKFLKTKLKWWLISTLLPIVLLSISLLAIFSMFMSFDESSSGADSDYDIEISELGEKEIPAKYIPIYKEAGKRYNIAWTLIAAFHKVETNFGTSTSMVSSAGAIGHFQFLPETWLGWGYGSNPPKSVYQNPALIAKYGGYGVDANNDGIADPYDVKDSAFACANYVSASGGMDNLRQAIFAYNHADWYVDRVLGYYNSYSKGDYTTSSGGSTNGGKGKGKFKLPVTTPYTITSPFGYRDGPFNGNELHDGIDFAGSLDAPVFASMDGTVITAGWVQGFGNTVIIQHSNGKKTLYGHMNKLKTSVGAKVKTGQQIGYMGSTGNSTGVHVHFTIMSGMYTGQEDPAPLLGL